MKFKDREHSGSRFRLTAILFCMICVFFSVGTAKESPGSLNIVHSHLNGVENCSSCHDPEYKIQSAKCLKCHTELSNRIESNNGYHQDKNGECEGCHEEHNGEHTPLIQWDPKEFDHSESGYILTGAHKKINNCFKCHSGPNAVKRKKSGSFLLKDNRCSACHKDVHDKNHPVCSDCHTTRDWRVDIWLP